MPIEIESLREELKNRVEIVEKDFLHGSVLKLSRKLDKLIIQKMKSVKN
ncbi:aspartyl-phosphate phosphatase Spo0E family protein [Halanaerobacter jeridensis]|uniref:Spo0E like sporulation regulatory protein n=1 Tax=Halanaerobacter jeridensis TaxID=706427 RepID=A0A938XW91_9FIRM|nr:aspartyl-phosphate phosphatase Spo0E family protein [Halanaerobacter jeridensis]MBM7556425.1 hypothetical protein [Halanaerobacter jeridensis]